MAGGTQIFVRNREGKVFGPIEPSTVELLIEGGVLNGLLQVSTDGERYALPFRFPELRDYFPRHLWGDDSRQEVQLDQEGPGPEAPAATEGGIAASLFGAGAEGEATDSSDEPLAPADAPPAPEAHAGTAARPPPGGRTISAPPVLTPEMVQPSAPDPAAPDPP